MQLLVRAENGADAELHGFTYLSFQNRKLRAGERFEGDTGEHELGLVILGGRCSVVSSREANVREALTGRLGETRSNLATSQWPFR